VKANTAGGERVRLSAAFTACANGEKLPVFAIIIRVNEIFSGEKKCMGNYL